MSCKECKKKKCGCSDKALTTPASCPQDLPSCPKPELCSETFSAGCVVYTGDEIADLGILKGERLDTIVQKLVLAFTQPACIFPGNSCYSVIGVQSSNITSSTAVISWSAPVAALSYTIEYRAITSGTWILNSSTTNSQDTISGLTANTEYLVRVHSICSSGDCFSLTIKIKTKLI